MTDSSWISRSEYREKIEELIDSGKLPKSYKNTLSSALGLVCAPKEEPALTVYKKYQISIPTIPDSLRAEMDKFILDKLVLEKRLSAVARDKLLRELPKMTFHHNKTSADLEFENTMRELDRLDREHKESVRKIEQAEKNAPFVAIGILGAFALVVVIAWSAFANWVNSQPDVYSPSTERTIPGLGITASEYQRRSDCLNFGC